MKKSNKSKKAFGVPAFIPDEATGWQKATEEQMRVGQRSVMGKGDKRRPCNEDIIRRNWDEIVWSKKPKLTTLSPEIVKVVLSP